MQKPQGTSKAAKNCVVGGRVLEYVRCLCVKHNELKVSMYETGSGIVPLWPHFAVTAMFLE